MSAKESSPSEERLLAEIAERGAEADPAEVRGADARLEELLERVEAPVATPAPVTGQATPGTLAPVAMRTATPIGIDGRKVRLRAGNSEAEAMLATGVSPELVRQAIVNGDAVLVECPEGEGARVVGVLQTRLPREVTIAARTIHIDAEEEVLLRSGRGALRIRKDGDVELVGSRISALSRGLFRLVGRMLRLN